MRGTPSQIRNRLLLLWAASRRGATGRAHSEHRDFPSLLPSAKPLCHLLLLPCISRLGGKKSKRVAGWQTSRQKRLRAAKKSKKIEDPRFWWKLILSLSFCADRTSAANIGAPSCLLLLLFLHTCTCMPCVVAAPLFHLLHCKREGSSDVLMRDLMRGWMKEAFGLQPEQEGGKEEERQQSVLQ